MENVKLFDASFDKYAKNYDNARPKYPEIMYEDIIKFCKLSAKDEILEIGSGSGLATKEFAKIGSKIISVEPGDNLVEVAKYNLSEYTNIEYICDTFENCNFSEKQFDSIISATAFHWLDKETKYMNTAKCLKDNGFLILFWNSFCRDNSDVMKKIDEVYDKHLSGVYAKKGDVNTGVLNKVITREQEIINNEYFYLASLKRYKTEYLYEAQSYAALLNTFPEIIKLDENTRKVFFEDIMKVIGDSGSKIKLPVMTTVYILRKKEQFTNDFGTNIQDIYSFEENEIRM
ncbi:MAG: class I SAM-dependent methyltransferase [Clostridiales bacterium]|nr:class I SAM-dependent methyltransferase [Clostridiales bacterium]